MTFWSHALHRAAFASRPCPAYVRLFLTGVLFARSKRGDARERVLPKLRALEETRALERELLSFYISAISQFSDDDVQ